MLNLKKMMRSMTDADPKCLPNANELSDDDILLLIQDSESIDVCVNHTSKKEEKTNLINFNRKF